MCGGGAYFGEGADNRALHDASEEDEVDVICARGRGHVSQVIQHLLHGCGGKKQPLDSHTPPLITEALRMERVPSTALHLG